MIRPIILAAILLAGCGTLEQRAETSAITDTVSTGVALGAGATELNPAGWGTIPLKIAAWLYCRSLDDDEQAQCFSAMSSVYGGATVSNVCVLFGPAMPICFAAGIGYGVYDWQQTAPQREFMATCEQVKRIWGMSEKCVYQIEAKND